MSDKILLLIDFDSTLCQVESLDFFTEKHKFSKQIQDLCNAAMSGNISFEESIKTRLDIIKPNKQELINVGKIIAKKYISQKTIDVIKKIIATDKFDIKIVSGGIYELLYPSLDILGIKNLNCVNLSYINDIYDGIIDNGFNVNKVVGIKKNISLENYKKIIAIGDGYSDYELLKFEIANDFICYCEFIDRNFIDNIKKMYSFDDVYEYLILL